VSLLEGTIDNHIFEAAESVSVELDVGDLLSKAVRFSSGKEMDAVFAVFSSDFKLGMMDFVVVKFVVFDSLAIPGDSESVAVLANTVSGGVVKLKVEPVLERIIVALGAVAAGLITTLMSFTQRDAGDNYKEKSKSEELLHYKIC
jgi:hypothetical protein